MLTVFCPESDDERVLLFSFMFDFTSLELVVEFTSLKLIIVDSTPRFYFFFVFNEFY